MVSNKGFTLIEMIASMLIISIIAGFSLLFLMTGASGFVTARENNLLTFRTHLAMARIAAELSAEMKSIETLSPVAPEKTYLKYLYQFSPQKDRQIALVGNGVRKAIVIVDAKAGVPDASDEEILVDNVSGFSMVFEKCDQSVWTTADSIEDLCRIEVSLTLFVNDFDSRTETFATTVTPATRNAYMDS